MAATPTDNICDGIPYTCDGILADGTICGATSVVFCRCDLYPDLTPLYNASREPVDGEYVVDGILYAKNFPKEFAGFNEKYGPPLCGNCEYYGYWDGAFYGFCLNCVYHCGAKPSAPFNMLCDKCDKPTVSQHYCGCEEPEGIRINQCCYDCGFLGFLESYDKRGECPKCDSINIGYKRVECYPPQVIYLPWTEFVKEIPSKKSE
jgi:hypothetical protein